tara:strand:+ start:2719 stop:4404 length:1686 start_codon:yes stop_codon:yes gene_type:complete
MTGAELALIASGVGTVANIGAGYFGGKDVKKANKENRRRAAMSNLIRSFGVDHRPVQQDVELGKTTRILQGIGKGANTISTGLNLYNTMKGQALARESAKKADELRGLQIDELKRASRAEEGARAALGAGMTSDRLPTPDPMSIRGTASEGFTSNIPRYNLDDAPSLRTLGRSDTPSLDVLGETNKNIRERFTGKTPSVTDATSGLVEKLTSLANQGITGDGTLATSRMQGPEDFGFDPGSIESLSFSATMSERLAKEQKDLADLENKKADTAYKNMLASKDPNTLTAIQKAQMNTAGRKILYDSLKAGMPNFVYSSLGEGTWEEFSADSSIAQSLKDLTPTEIKGLKNDFKSAKDGWAKVLNEDTDKVLRSDIKPLLDKNQLFKYSGGLQFAYLSIARGYLEGTGQGDIAMIIGLARLKDPGVSVRAEDVNTEEKAITELERLKLLGSGERIFGEGGRMIPEVRKRFMSMGQSLYQGVIDAVNDEDTGLPSIRRAAEGLTLPGADLKSINLIIDTFNMPSVESYGVDLIKLTEKDRNQIGVSNAIDQDLNTINMIYGYPD